LPRFCEISDIYRDFVVDRELNTQVTRMSSPIEEIYGHKVRVRVCGLCWQDEKLLLVNHKSLTDSDFWAPPGGGLEFGESMEEGLKREFREETGLEVFPGRFLFGCELIAPPLHAVELFFEVTHSSGVLRAGHDPELQIIQDAAYLSFEEILAIPGRHRHGIFQILTTAGDLGKLGGFYRI
jgi:8-oxo-dGTP diphosphatase